VAEEELTCGKGLAQNSVLPAKLGELEAALAAVLEAHMTALDLSDEKSRREHEVYERITRKHREAAEGLEAVATDMADQGDLPMGPHDMEALGGGEQMAAFERYVRVKRELLTLFQDTLSQEEAMMATMRGPRDTG
jgi:hypothetical protein